MFSFIFSALGLFASPETPQQPTIPVAYITAVYDNNDDVVLDDWDDPEYREQIVCLGGDD